MPDRIVAQTGMGITYGLYDFNIECVQEFIEWLHHMGHPYAAVLNNVPGSREFSVMWKEIAERDATEFAKLQTEFKYNILLLGKEK